MLKSSKKLCCGTTACSCHSGCFKREVYDWLKCIIIYVDLYEKAF